VTHPFIKKRHVKDVYQKSFLIPNVVKKKMYNENEKYYKSMPTDTTGECYNTIIPTVGTTGKDKPKPGGRE